MSSKELIEHKLRDIHEDIKNLTTLAVKTNGRISALERWRSYMAGAVSVIVLLLIPIVIQYISKVVYAK